ncbi:uncharacterized protein LOC121373864 [Gigantopelta aegis]|uniref:uncharacterized protein LOC121373864 n=1 Tax=Gigantopelta aegis TaxID=1735272 RepID=UPI001B88A67A|nr:uncharacterized protein LOC121373864 [Gigantopelta aegis]
MSSTAPKMSDFGKHSNAKPRPLGEVKAESACFDFLGSNNPLITRTFESACDIDRHQLIMNRLHENLITTALIADVSSANSNAEQTHRKGGNVQSNSLGPNFSAMHLVSTLVSPRSRTISIPKQRDFLAYDLRINTAPNAASDMDGVEVFDSQGDVTYGHHQTSEWNQKNSPRHTSNWGEYRRQLSTAKKKELTRKLSQLSKCEAVDIMDPVQGSLSQYSSPMIIMSQSQRDEENEILNAAADALLQRSRRTPLVFSASRKRSRTTVRDTGVFSRSTKIQNGQQQTGQLPDGIIGRNIDSGFGLAPDSCMGEDILYTGRAGGSSRLWRRHVSYQDRVQPPKDRPSSKQREVNALSGYSLQARSAKGNRDDLFKLQGKSLPRLPKQNSYTENLRLLQKKKQNEHLPQEFHNFDSLQQRVQSMSHTDTFWTIPEAMSETEDARTVSTGFRAPRKIPTKLPPYNETLHAQTLVYTRNKSPTYSNMHHNNSSSPSRGIKYDINSHCGHPAGENVKDDDLHGTFRLTELRDDEIVDVDSDGDDLTDSDSDEEDRLSSIRFGDELTRQPLDIGKYQGTTSRISEDEAGSQFHLVNGENGNVQEETYKILKALDKDVYFDYEHKKYRKAGTAGSLGSSDNPRVHFLKVKVNKSVT